MGSKKRYEEGGFGLGGGLGFHDGHIEERMDCLRDTTDNFRRERKRGKKRWREMRSWIC